MRSAVQSALATLVYFSAIELSLVSIENTPQELCYTVHSRGKYTLLKRCSEVFAMSASAAPTDRVVKCGGLLMRLHRARNQWSPAKRTGVLNVQQTNSFLEPPLVCYSVTVSYDSDTKRSAIADCTARRLWNVKRASFLLGVGAFRPRFYENGVIPCQNVDAVR